MCMCARVSVYEWCVYGSYNGAGNGGGACSGYVHARQHAVTPVVIMVAMVKMMLVIIIVVVVEVTVRSVYLAVTSEPVAFGRHGTLKGQRALGLFAYAAICL